MDIWQIDKLALFLIFFIPGFISIRVYDLLIPSERRDFSKSLLDAVGFSALNFAALSWLIIIIHSNNFYSAYPIAYFASLVAIMFVAPILWPFALLKLFSWPPIAKYVVHPIQKPWDYVFGNRESLWVIAHLKDRRRIAGRFDTKSFASSFPAGEQIYLEEVWELDEKGRFKNAIPRSRGIIILGDELAAIEFFK